LCGGVGGCVRDLEGRGGHRAGLEALGGGTCIDMAMVDRLPEPMLPLVRNAVAHGIEAPEERLRAGKPAEGRITISALNQGDRVRVAVADDGRGLDEERIRARARARGIDTSVLSQAEVQRLIFLHGFSTAEKVSA